MPKTQLKVEIITCTHDPDIVTATAIRTCRSDKSIRELWALSEEAVTTKDNEKLIRECIRLGHTSVLEHVVFTFSIEGISRACSHQLVRNRIGFSYSQQSQRHVSAKNFDYIVPKSVEDAEMANKYQSLMELLSDAYRGYMNLGIPAEDARYLLPNACATQLTCTMNARAIYNFLQERLCRDAQWEIQALAREILRLVRDVTPELFPSGLVGPKCATGGRCPKTDCPGPRW